MKKRWYTLLLTVSMVIAAAGKCVPAAASFIMRETGGAQAEAPAENGKAGGSALSGEANGALSGKANGGALPSKVSGGALPSEAGGDSPPQPKAYQAAMEQNFSGTLFIGDSRTDGLAEYGDLGEAEVFAASGMSVFNLFQESASLKGGGKMQLEEVLSEQRFQTIFLMLGINELGYDYPLLLKQYRATVERIRQLQPSAVLILEANLHVTQSQASQSTVFNNDRINRLNQDIQKIAEETGSSYIDVNPIFDDAGGNLTAEYSGDGVHVLAKYYKMWSDWLRECPPR